MATLNGIYIFVKDEDVSHNVESSSHPVEKGVDITDHIQRKAVELSLKGKIVDYGDIKASNILSQIKELQRSGSLITFLGRNNVSNLQIQSFSTSHPYTNCGGCDFNMSLKELRVANSSYSAINKSAGTQQIQSSDSSGTKVYHTVKKGETAWELGEKTYKSQGSSVGFITANNKDKVPNGDWTKLKVGTSLYVCNKK